MMPQFYLSPMPPSVKFRPIATPSRPIFIMRRPAPTVQTVLHLLRPETATEKQLLLLPEIEEGMLWGEPRFGHPEGKVYLHVREVLDNIERVEGISRKLREQLRLVAILHDAFKFCEDRTIPRDWSRHHGVLARKFAEKYISDPAVLDVIETHDDAYYAWRGSRIDHAESKIGEKTLEKLLDRVGHCLQLYYVFFKCDTQTGDKTQASWKWFEKQVPEIQLVRVKD